MLPGALDLQEDGVGVVGKQHAGDQAKHLGEQNDKLNETRIAIKIPL